MDKPRDDFKRKVILSVVFLCSVLAMLGIVPVVDLFAQEAAPAAEQQVYTAERADVTKWAVIAAAAAFGFGAIGAGIGIAYVGAAAMGAIGERPEIAGQALIFVALAEGLVVFGFITALMILGRV